MLGNGRLEAMCIDSTKRLCHIRGKMRKKVWVNTVRHTLRCIMSSCTGWLVLISEHVTFNYLVTRGSEVILVQGDIILVGLRDYQDEKADVILK